MICLYLIILHKNTIRYLVLLHILKKAVCCPSLEPQTAHLFLSFILGFVLS